MRHDCAACALLLASTLPAQTTVSQDRTVRIPRVTRAPRLEDFLDGKSPDAGVKVTDFRQNQPGDGQPVSEETTAYLSYDRDNLYIVFVCKAPPGATRARYTRRDDLFPDDVVGVNFDTWHDRQRSFFFYSNAHGIQFDGLHTEGQGDDDSFDTLWSSEGRITPDGFVVWMAFPFRSLRFSTGKKQSWGIALSRQTPSKSEYAWWPFITNRVDGFVRQFGTLEGLEDISPGRNLQLIPYAFGARAKFLSPPGYADTLKGRAGLDGKAVIHDALTFDFTYNPDFSQVESDEPQVTVNQRFEVFFRERRPFFIENSGFFQTPQNLFFSRRIVDPEFGARLTGKLGRWVLGALSADDRAPGRGIDGSKQRAQDTALRAKREFRKDSNIGLLATSSQLAGSFNRVFSADARVRLSQNWSYDGQAMFSDDKGPAQRAHTGSGYFSQLQHNGRHYTQTTKYEDFSPGFHTELGFIPRVDIRRVSQDFDYRWRPEKSRMFSYGPFVNLLKNWDHAGRLEDWSAKAGFVTELKGSTLLVVSHTQFYEYFQLQGFRKETSGLYFSTERWKRIGFNGELDTGTEINYAPAAGVQPFLANLTYGNLAVNLRPSSRLRLENSYFFTRLAGRSAEGSLFNNHILRSKIYYQFNREFSLRGIFDYNAVLPNTQLVSQELTKRFNADVLFTYLLHPGTAVYFGYSDRRENLSLDGFRRPGPPNLNTGRQVFVKVSYLLRF